MDEYHTTPELEADGRRTSAFAQLAELVWLGSIALVLTLVVVAAVVSGAAVSPRFCATCHGPAVETLAMSSHKGLDCDSCHRSSGPLGLVENMLWVAGMVIEAPFNALSGASAGHTAVDRQRCIDCHERQLAVTGVRNGVRMSHDAPIDEGWSCQRCHRDIAHGESGRSVATYSMGTCLGCHSTGPDNLTGCTTCHPSGMKPNARHAVATSWKVTHGENWQRTHGMGELSTCKACHGPDYCVSCHEIALPHSSTYLSTHGDEVAAVGTSTCLRCHEEASCNACHGGVQMPHPASFLKGHKADVERLGMEACTRCHAEQSCESCHSRHTHPGLTPERLNELKKRPVEPR